MTAGDVLKMNGRWARVECLPVAGGGQPMLVAVELDETFQRALDAAQPELEQVREQGQSPAAWAARVLGTLTH